MDSMDSVAGGTNAAPAAAASGSARSPYLLLLFRLVFRRKCLKHALSVCALMLILSPALLALLYPGLRPAAHHTSDTISGAAAAGTLSAAYPPDEMERELMRMEAGAGGSGEDGDDFDAAERDDEADADAPLSSGAHLHSSRERTAGELKAHLMSSAHRNWNDLDWKASYKHVAWGKQTSTRQQHTASHRTPHTLPRAWWTQR